MAQRTEVIIVDDLTGDILSSGEEQTISFALDGASYEIDLSQENADSLREDFKRYIRAARKTGRDGGTRSMGRRGSGDRKDTATIREWAKSNGHVVSERGRIPSSVIEAYEAAS